jgi:hypothetical protein
MGSKQKGIVLQSIKEILDSLVSDNLVTMEKIGTSNYYWSFPSQSAVIRKCKLQALEKELQSILDKNQALQLQIDSAQALRNGSAERDSRLQQLLELEKEKDDLSKELLIFKDTDPETIKQKKESILISKEAGNRWTGNAASLRNNHSR